MFGFSEKKIDKPDQVAFIKAISENLPSQKDSQKLWYGVAAAYIGGKVYRNVKKNR